jgi:hypothetical protein
MYSLSIAFGSTAWALMFRTKEAAEKALSEYVGPPCRGTSEQHALILTDDFGQHARIEHSSIHGIMLEDLDQSKLGMIERALHQQRTQLLLNKMVETDPGLRAARTGGSGAILSPMGNGNFRPNS